MNSTGQEQHDNWHRVDELLKDGKRHNWAIAERISGDKHEHNLPKKRHAQESIIELRMGDWRWGVMADSSDQKVKREQRNESVCCRDAINDFRKFHFRSPSLVDFSLATKQRA